MFDKTQIDIEIQKRKVKVEYYETLKKVNNENSSRYQDVISNIQKKIKSIQNERMDCINVTKKYANTLRKNNKMREKYVNEVSKKLNGKHMKNALVKLENTQNVFKRKIAKTKDENENYKRKIKKINSEIVQLKKELESLE